MRLLFINYSSTFNTIVPFRLLDRLRELDLFSSLCHWVLDFLTGWLQIVKVGGFASTPLLSTQ